MVSVRVSAKADYALRAVIELAAVDEGPVKGERIAQAQEIPLKFLENILGDLRHAGVVRSQRGAEGGYWLARNRTAEAEDEGAGTRMCRQCDPPGLRRDTAVGPNEGPLQR